MTTQIEDREVLTSGVVLANHGETVHIDAGTGVRVRLEFVLVGGVPKGPLGSGIDADRTLFNRQLERDAPAYMIGFGVNAVSVVAWVENVFATVKRITYTVTRDPNFVPPSQSSF